LLYKRAQNQLKQSFNRDWPGKLINGTSSLATTY